MTSYEFHQVDVFSAQPLKGNPLAVVVGADSLSDAQMTTFASWTNLSETTFLLQPRTPKADYRVRIFTPGGELPFAGHPTLGSCHVWLAAGGMPKAAEIVQECGAGLVRVRRDGDRLAFAAPPLRRSGPVDEATLGRVVECLGIAASAVVRAQWVDNGPGWVAIMLATREELLAVKPDLAAMAGLDIGVVAPWDDGEVSFEVRAFAPCAGVPEDPVTGSLNAGLAQWLIAENLAPSSYAVSQGTVLGRAGRVYVEQVEDDIWVGGDITPCITGRLSL